MINPPKPKEGPKPTKKDLEIMLQVSFPIKDNPKQWRVKWWWKRIFPYKLKEYVCSFELKKKITASGLNLPCFNICNYLLHFNWGAEIINLVSIIQKLIFVKINELVVRIGTTVIGKIIYQRYRKVSLG